MRRLFYNYQWVCILIALGFFGAAVIYHNEAKELEEKPTSDYIVIGQYCHSYQKQSSVHVKSEGKTYTIWVKRNECREYPVGSQIKLVYSEKYDYFYRADDLKAAEAKMKVRIILLLFTLLPLKYFETRIKSINK